MPEKEEKLKANLAINLQYLRIRHKLSQVSLAKHLGISPRSISYYESGRYLPPAHVLCAMALYFGYTVEELLGEHLPANRGGRQTNENITYRNP